MRARWLLALVLVLAPSPSLVGADPVRLYAQHCAVCHGATGRGDGPAAGLLAPRPRDFTSGVYRFRSTPAGTLPTVEDVARSIALGLPGTSMSAFGDRIASDGIESLARFVLSLAPQRARRGAPIALVSGAPSRRGAELYASAGCGICHGADGRAAAWRPTREGPGGEQPPRDLTTPWTFRGGATENAIALRVLTGLDGSSMTAYAGALAAPDARELARHVLSLARRPIWSEPDPASIRTAGVATDPLERGRYLVRAMQCPLCHTPIDPESGAYDTAHFLAGGMRVSAYPWGTWYSRNLTPDAETGLGRWSEADVVNAVTRGMGRDGRRLDPVAMPWPWFSKLTPSDARAIAVYLGSLPPVRNAVPMARRVPWPERVGGQVLALLGAPVTIEFWGGNAALDPTLGGGAPFGLGRRVAASALGWGTLLLVVVGPVIALARRLRRRRLVVAVACAALAGWLTLGMWPPFALLSPEATTTWLFLGTPRLPAALAGAERALAERGEYLATIAPCGLCHTPASAFAGFLTSRTLAGGMEARWRVYGRAVSSNLTAHPTDGIGRIADVTLVRAMRSGVGADGRALHWQAMPWDIISNWSEEDQRAMLAYFRALPAVPGRVPASRPPRPGDPPADSFSFGDAVAR